MLEDFLFLGNGTVAKNIQLLESHDITYVLNVAGESVETGPNFYPEGYLLFFTSFLFLQLTTNPNHPKASIIMKFVQKIKKGTQSYLILRMYLSF